MIAADPNYCITCDTQLNHDDFPHGTNEEPQCAKCCTVCCAESSTGDALAASIAADMATVKAMSQLIDRIKDATDDTDAEEDEDETPRDSSVTAKVIRLHPTTESDN